MPFSLPTVAETRERYFYMYTLKEFNIVLCCVCYKFSAGKEETKLYIQTFFSIKLLIDWLSQQKTMKKEKYET